MFISLYGLESHYLKKKLFLKKTFLDFILDVCLSESDKEKVKHISSTVDKSSTYEVQKKAVYSILDLLNMDFNNIDIDKRKLKRCGKSLHISKKVSGTRLNDYRCAT